MCSTFLHQIFIENFPRLQYMNNTQDELVEHSTLVPKAPSNPHINIIIDHSAFVRGFGNVRRWFEEEYVLKNIHQRRKTTKSVLNLFIPEYTLREFEFSKRGGSMMATNTREAIKFIDKTFGEDVENAYFIYRFTIEDKLSISWSDCLKNQVRVPSVNEFPNYKSSFDTNSLFKRLMTMDDGFGEDNITPSSEAEMPIRLRQLIRSCVQKLREKRSPESSEWRLLTEDPITRIWAQSFGIGCLNVNEAEILIFQNHDVNGFRKFNPHNTFEEGDDDYSHQSDVLHTIIDTTKYEYEHENDDNHSKLKGNSNKGIKEKKDESKGNKKTNKKKRDRTAKKQNNDNHDKSFNNNLSVKKEDYNTINFAPRGTGAIWRP